MSRILPFGDKVPRIAPDAFVAPGATLIGDVTLEPGSSVWFGAVLRGDNPENGIVVGEGANIQDNAVVHVGDWCPTVVEAGVTVGHGAVFESCTIGEGSLVGMNAVILPETEIGPESLVAAGCVLLEGTRVPERSVVAGVPGKVRKTLDGSAADWVRNSGRHYRELSRRYLQEGIGAPPREAAATPARRRAPGDAGERAGASAGARAEQADGRAEWSAAARRPGAEPDPDPTAGGVCERCGGPLDWRHCKLVCTNCGFHRDCSDP